MTAESAGAERAVAESRHELEDSDIESRVLKGPALAHLDYPTRLICDRYIHPNLLVEAGSSSSTR